jgi:hypothetical protein
MGSRRVAAKLCKETLETMPGPHGPEDGGWVSPTVTQSTWATLAVNIVVVSPLELRDPQGTTTTVVSGVVPWSLLFLLAPFRPRAWMHLPGLVAVTT